MGVEAKDRETISKVLFQLPLRTFAHVIVSVPALSLLLCLVTSVLFQFDQVNETACNVSFIIMFLLLCPPKYSRTNREV